MSPAARSRSFSAPARQGEQHGRRILDLESATREDFIRESELLRKEADEVLARVWEYNEKIIPGVEQELYKTVKVMAGVWAAVELLDWVISSRQTTVDSPSDGTLLLMLLHVS